ncbi:MAG: DUF3575 domain-containing protein, partial [Bacteroides sp.]|nr:DUF3575 domain-containing protein [Bacteroides sp.]
MYRSKQIITLLLLLCSMWTHAQVSVEQMEVYFRQGRATWDAEYMENSLHLKQLVEAIQEIQQDSIAYQIQRIQLITSCSPEGSIHTNQRLARQRMSAIQQVLHKHFTFNDSIVSSKTITEDWDGLLLLAESDSLLPYREEVIELLRSMPDCIAQGERSLNNCKLQLQTIHKGEPWRYMYRHFFPTLRRFSIHIYIGTRAPEELIAEDELSIIEEADSLFEIPFTDIPYREVAPAPVVEVIEAPTSSRGLYVKSNAIGWAMLIGNVAVEWQFADDWSATLPVYYSALNYFTSDVKFRTLCFQPEVRYWIPALKGFFAGAHFGLAWFNYAKGGDYRYQDHFRHTPMMG